MSRSIDSDTAPRIPPVYRRPNFWRDNIEGFIGVALLVLVMRYFAFEVFKIPTGSMAPTLVGQHQRVECPNCGFRYDIDAAFRPGRGVPGGVVTESAAGCPNCGRRFTPRANDARYAGGFLLRFLQLKRDRISGGNRIIVNKFNRALEPPTRWSIIVFEHTQRRPPINYIKRLVGLPGETISIWNGDLYADGQLLRRPPKIQESMWQPVFDSRYVPKEKVRNLWESPAGSHAWNDAGMILQPDARGEARLVYAPPILDYPPYRGNLNRGEAWWRSPDRFNEVGDLKCEIEVSPKPRQPIFIRLREANDVYVAAVRFDNGAVEGAITLEPAGPAGVPPAVLVEPVTSAVSDGPHTIAFYNADQRLRLSVDGEELCRLDLPAVPMPGAPARFPSGVSIEARGLEGPLTLERVRIWRDIYYLHDRARSVHSYGPIPRKSYFVLGDNTSSSEDSRFWPESPYVPDKQIVGTALVVWWPPEYLRAIPVP
jgi:signal peptidase I